MRLSQLMLPDVERAFRDDPATIIELFNELHAEDVADLIEGAGAELGPELLATLDAERAAEVLECIQPELQASLIHGLGSKRAAPIVAEMSSDDRADMVGDLPQPLADALLDHMDPEAAEEVRRLVAYEDDTVGSVMATDLLEATLDMSVGQVIERVRMFGEESETVYYVYVVTSTGKLVGVVSLRELILARPDQSIADIMRNDVISVQVTGDQEEAARIIEHYDLIAVPVVDVGGTLLGLVTVDDVMDVLQEEATEDMHRMAAVQPIDTSYFHTTFWHFVRKRAPWLVALFIGEMFTSDALGQFEDLIQHTAILVIFLPLIISSGGNSGSQSASIVIRALALGEVSLKQAWKVVRRELGMGLVLGAMLSVIGVARALIWGDGADIAIIVGATLICVVTLGTLLGAIMPILLQRLGMDPAVSSTPFIASLSDLLGILTYFTIARFVIGAT
mgnify:CR=1 FL=1